jgi:superoxide dismutase
MKLHHLKHHQAYVNGLNAAEEAYIKAPSTRERIALQAALKFNGGGKPSPPAAHFCLPELSYFQTLCFTRIFARFTQAT